jgi:hypothetical protein
LHVNYTKVQFDLDMVHLPVSHDALTQLQCKQKAQAQTCCVTSCCVLVIAFNLLFTGFSHGILREGKYDVCVLAIVSHSLTHFSSLNSFQPMASEESFPELSQLVSCVQDTSQPIGKRTHAAFFLRTLATREAVDAIADGETTARSLLMSALCR